MGLGGGFLCNRKERGSELFPWWGNVFLCMNSSGQQHYEGYVITSLSFFYKNNQKRVTISHFSHLVTMNKTSSKCV